MLKQRPTIRTRAANNASHVYHYDAMQPPSCLHGSASTTDSADRKNLSEHQQINKKKTHYCFFPRSPRLYKVFDFLFSLSEPCSRANASARPRFDRIESQIRLLADSAFVMRDFDTAAEMYRMARDDFKSDR